MHERRGNAQESFGCRRGLKICRPPCFRGLSESVVVMGKKVGEWGEMVQRWRMVWGNLVMMFGFGGLEGLCTSGRVEARSRSGDSLEM